MSKDLHLQEVEDLGKLQFPEADVAIILEVKKLNKEEKKAYERGKLLAAAEIRKAIYTMAKNGSSPAQVQMLKIMEEEDQKKRFGGRLPK